MLGLQSRLADDGSCIQGCIQLSSLFCVKSRLHREKINSASLRSVDGAEQSQITPCVLNKDDEDQGNGQELIQMSACICSENVFQHTFVASSQAAAQCRAAHLYGVGRISHFYRCCYWHMLAVGVSHQWGEPTAATDCWLLGSCQYIDKLCRVCLWLSRQVCNTDHTMQLFQL